MTFPLLTGQLNSIPSQTVCTTALKWTKAQVMEMVSLGARWIG